MIEQGFNNADSTVKVMNDFFETIVEILETKEEKKSSAAAKEPKDKKSTEKRKREESDSSVVNSNKVASVKHKTTKKYCILHGKCSHFKDKCTYLHAMVIIWKEQQRI